MNVVERIRNSQREHAFHANILFKSAYFIMSCAKVNVPCVCISSAARWNAVRAARDEGTAYAYAFDSQLRTIGKTGLDSLQSQNDIHWTINRGRCVEAAARGHGIVLYEIAGGGNSSRNRRVDRNLVGAGFQDLTTRRTITRQAVS